MSQETALSSQIQEENPKPNQKSRFIRRSRMETFCDILQALGAGVQKPTHVMFRANLSWPILKSSIRTLEAQGLVLILNEEGRRTYRLTEKGYKMLGSFLQVRNELNLT